MRSRKPTLRRRLRRIARIPRDLRNPARRGAALRRLAGLACAAVLAAGGLYTAAWFANRARVEREGERYSAMYAPARESAAAALSTHGSAETILSTPESAAAALSTSEPAETILSTPESAEASAPPSAAPAQAEGTPASQAEVADEPLPTPDEGTAVYALETPPPVQASFSELLAYNSDTVGFLQIGDIVSLPVVQRRNDNEYYLTHAFSGAESAEGALFLDGMNLLVPEDDCLIVYGHNMQNGTMFGDLKLYREGYFLRACPPVSFDTIYENRRYAPFSVFVASTDSADEDYFDVRQFVFDEAGFDAFVAALRGRSEYDVPLDVQYGDALLLLVTCDSADADGRLIVAFRALREGETEQSVAERLAQAQ